MGDDGRTQRIIRTIHGRGYRFVARLEGSDVASTTQHPEGDAASGALPLQPTPLVGREAELDEVVGRAAATRLLTLTGPGGVGKTRLAIELAIRLRGRHPDGVRFVGLAEVREPGMVPRLVADALGLQGERSDEPVLAVQESLRGRSLLLVLDNFEHVVAAAPLVSELLAGSPTLSIVTTSRERFASPGSMSTMRPLEVDPGERSGHRIPPAGTGRANAAGGRRRGHGTGTASGLRRRCCGPRTRGPPRHRGAGCALTSWQVRPRCSGRGSAPTPARARRR